MARQEADERAWVEQVSGIVEKVYTENDTSAYKKRKVVLPDGTVVWRVVRPLWEEMLKDLRSGVIQGVVVYDLDRLARDPRDLEDAIEIVEHHRRPVVGLTGGFDLLTDSGKFAARILVACANKASADTARRVRRKHVDLQAEGSTGSGPRPFGWADDHATLHPTEAPIVQRVCRQVGEGIPIDAIVRDLNKQGITGTRGKPWRVSTLKPYLRNPRLCGWRGRTVGTVNPQTGETCRHVEIVRDAAGNPVVGQWQPIITPEQWETVVEKIGTRKQPGNGHNARRYLLSGITRCGECGRKMSGMPRPDGRGYAYRCNPQNLGCSKIVRDGIKVDAYVTAALLAKVEMELSQAVAVVDTTWSRETELADTEKEIAELTARFKAKTISSGRYYDLLAHLEGQERELLAERRKHTAAVRATKARPANVRAEWNSDGCPLSWKRAIIEDYIHAVVVNKARYKGARFDPDLLDITWKGEADADVAPEAEAA
ncbi:recombinase family protein [Frankia sp. QA3]|uniref:recombinase family protein n=1 Tax=Frankia sp. QA3 TaxID=710111 RepID=UPI000269CA47|nr:recombinase family protein [Frankia sp. QA3]EIV94706.1 site-specific recombinase, DNA invertase Pin [Frankia sp. QA3]